MLGNKGWEYNDEQDIVSNGNDYLAEVTGNCKDSYHQYHKCHEKTQFGFYVSKENRHIVRNGAISRECMQQSIPGERAITFVLK